MRCPRLCQAARRVYDAVELSWRRCPAPGHRVLRAGLAERWRGGARAFRKAPFLLESVPTTHWPVPSRENADMSAVRRGDPARAPIATVHRGCLGGCPADEPPRHPGP